MRSKKMKVELDDIEIHYSNLSRAVCAGIVNEEQTGFEVKTDVTTQAILAVVGMLFDSEDKMMIITSPDTKMGIKLKATITRIE